MEFSKEQRQAVTHGTGPMLVLAGPGSGKTATIIGRVLYLTEQMQVPAEHILVITFTKAAAKEMEHRYHGLLAKSEPDRVCFSTFHALFFKILRESAGFSQDSLLKESEKYWWIRDILYRLCPEREQEQDGVRRAMDDISRFKNHSGRKDGFIPSMEKALFQQIYQEYETGLRRDHRLDFDDLLCRCYQLLLQDKAVLRTWQERYHFLMIDEFQDANSLQYEIAKLLAGEAANLFVVGDDDQSIYGFRGAVPDLMGQFQRDYPNAKQTVLALNYRSCINVTKMAAKLIRQNKNREYKYFSNATDQRGLCEIYRYPDRTEEYRGLISLIQESSLTLKEQAVLYRTNDQPRALIQQLMDRNLPYSIKERPSSLWQHWVTQDIAAYLRLGEGSHDRRDFLRVCNRPNRFLSRELFRQPLVDTSQILLSLRGRYEQQEAANRLFFDIGMIKRMNPFAAIQYIRKGVGYENFLLSYAREHQRSAEELMELLEELNDTARDAFDYNAWETRLRRSEEASLPEAEQGQEKLTLMTFHGAKGLEYRRVYLIDLNEGVVPHKRAGTKEEMEEERRLLYVAMTRAKEELYLLYTEKRGGRSIPPSRFLNELM